jgi:periplasmic divalent cation tolerance protein
MGEIMILSTADTMELAGKIAQSLVEEGCAACVNIVPGIRSVYRWEGKICDDSELLLLIKTSEGHYEHVRQSILRLHSYNTPEVITLAIGEADTDYRNWLHAQLRPCQD